MHCQVFPDKNAMKNDFRFDKIFRDSTINYLNAMTNGRRIFFFIAIEMCTYRESEKNNPTE